MSDTLPQDSESLLTTDSTEVAKSISNQEMVSYIDQFWTLLQDTYEATLEGARPVKPDDALRRGKKIRELVASFDYNMSLIKDRNLKALAIHDTKNITGSLIMVLGTFERIGVTEALRPYLQRPLRKLINFLKMLRLSLYEPGSNGGVQLLKIEEMFLSLCDTVEPVGNPKTFRAVYHSVKKVETIELLIKTNILGLVINEYPSVVFAIHTILLNMTEWGATNIEIELTYTDSLYVINLYDDVVVPGDSNEDVVKRIAEKISLEPEENLDTKQLVTEGGLRLSKALLRKNGCALRCSSAKGMSKCFSIIIPKGNLDITGGEG